MVRTWRLDTESTSRYWDWSGGVYLSHFDVHSSWMAPPVAPVRPHELLPEFGFYYMTLSTPWITGVLSPKPPQRAKWRYYYRLTLAWTTSQHWLLKNAWKLNPKIKLNRRKKNQKTKTKPHSGVFITFPLLLTSSTPLLVHDFAPNSSSFPTNLNTSHHISLSHFGFTFCISCSESYITYLLLLMWWCLRPLFTALHFSFCFPQAPCLEKHLFTSSPNNCSFLQ